MRVISKLGEDDIPYELSVFWRDETVIWAIIPGFGKIIMAQYSSQGKAEKAMQKLHECYLGICVTHMSSEFDGDESFLNSFGIYKISENGDYAYNLPSGKRIFQFPREDEL